MTAGEAVGRLSITAVWEALGGDPPRRGRSKAFWRGGDGFNVALCDEKGTWYDHRDNIGGGIVALVQHVRGGTAQEALRWLADHFGIPFDEPTWTPEQRENWARRRRDAERVALPLARAAQWWFRERCEELNEQKAAAIADGNIDVDAARELFRLERLTPEDVLREYLRFKREHPSECFGLVRAGQIWDQFCEAAVQAVIDKIRTEQQQEQEAAAHDAG